MWSLAASRSLLRGGQGTRGISGASAPAGRDSVARPVCGRFRRERPEVETRSAAVRLYGEHRSFEIGSRSRKLHKPLDGEAFAAAALVLHVRVVELEALV